MIILYKHMVIQAKILNDSNLKNIPFLLNYYHLSNIVL